MSTLKSEIEELKRVKLESGSLEEQMNRRKEWERGRKIPRQPLKRAQRRETANISAIHVFGRRKTPLSKRLRQELPKWRRCYKGSCKKHMRFERNVLFFLGFFLSPSYVPYGTLHAQTSRQQERRGKGSKPATPKTTSRSRQLCLWRKRRRVVKLVAKRKPTGKKAIFYVGNFSKDTTASNLEVYIKKRSEPVGVKPPMVYGSNILSAKNYGRFCGAHITTDHASASWFSDASSGYDLSMPGSGFSETSKDKVTNRASREQPVMENDDVVQRYEVKHTNVERFFFSKPLLPNLYPSTKTLIETEKFSLKPLCPVHFQ